MELKKIWKNSFVLIIVVFFALGILCNLNNEANAEKNKDEVIIILDKPFSDKGNADTLILSYGYSDC